MKTPHERFAEAAENMSDIVYIGSPLDYASGFEKEESTREFWIGCSDYRTNRAFVYVIEAARQLAAVKNGAAIELLSRAIQEIKMAEL